MEESRVPQFHSCSVRAAYLADDAVGERPDDGEVHHHVGGGELQLHLYTAILAKTRSFPFLFFCLTDYPTVTKSLTSWGYLVHSLVSRKPSLKIQ